jgi:hypothetical protein
LIIQFLLVLGFLFLFGFSLLLLLSRNLLLGIPILALSLSGAIFSLQPKLATDIANLMGVSRGTDLLVYVLFFLFILALINTLARFKSMEQKMTEIVRQLALKDPHHESELPH